MPRIQLLPAITLIFVLCIRLSAAEPNLFETVCEYPTKNAVYASTSNIVVTGWSNAFGGVGVAGLHDWNQVTHQNSGFQIRMDGNWSCRLQLSQYMASSPGDYRLMISTVRGRRIALPISIISDPCGADIQPGLPFTVTGTPEYATLPAVKFLEVTLSDSDDSAPERLDRADAGNPGISIDAQFEFAVEGSLRLQQRGIIGPAEVVLRLADAAVGPDGKERQQKIILNEYLCRLLPTNNNDVFEFHEVLRAPKRDGKFLLETIYREKVISTATLQVRQSSESPPGIDWVIEHPPANTRYALTSEIVVTGTGKLYGEPITVLVRDSSGRVDPVGRCETGQFEQNGAWSCRLYRFTNHSGWPPGDCQIIVRPQHGALKTVPVKILTTADDPRIAIQKETKLGSGVFDALPQLNLADVTMSRPDVDQPEVVSRAPKVLPSVEIEADQEFAVRGSLLLKAPGDVAPSPIVVRLKDNADRSRKSDEAATLDEAIAEYGDTGAGRIFPFEAVIRAPGRQGTYSLETIYRRAVIASATVVVIGADPNGDHAVCVYPAKDAVYASASDIAVIGRNTAFETRCEVYLRDGENTKAASAGCVAGPFAEDGKWSCRLSMWRGDWRPGRYTLDIVPNRGPRTSFPISIVASSDPPSTQRYVTRTKVDSAEYHDLPCFKLANVILPKSDRKINELSDVGKPAGDGFIIDAGAEFAVECTAHAAAGDTTSPLDLVFRLTDPPTSNGNGPKKTKPIVRESFARTEPADDARAFRCRSVLRAPNRMGSFVLETVYCNQIIATSEIQVRPSQKPAADADWTVEFPPSKSVYGPAPEIVVAGSRFRGAVAFVELLDANQAVQSIVVADTGNRRENANWSCRLPLPARDNWRPGDYQIAVRPNSGGRIVIPITLTGDAEKSAAVRSEQTELGSEAYDALPRLQLDEIIMAKSHGDNPKSAALEKGPETPFIIDFEQEFAIEGVLSFEDTEEFDPFEVIIRLSRSAPGDGRKPDNSPVTVGETIARYYDAALLQRGFPFRAILRAPQAPGPYTLETIYRRAVINTTPVKVDPATPK
jgi:hypothetical protein